MNFHGKNIHIIGMCGKGTSALAVLLKEYGAIITGSDAGVYEPIKGYLERKKIQCRSPYQAANIPKNVDLICMGSSATLNRKINLEVDQAYQMNVPILSFAEILEIITQSTQNVVVAGSYGKSTNTALLAHLTQKTGIDSSFFIGALPINTETSAHHGSSDVFILEGDEYPHAQDDMCSKFLKYNPHAVLLTSCEHDHVNKFPTIESYLEPYRQLMALVPEAGLVVAAHTHPFVGEVISHTNARVITYGINSGDYHAQNITYGEISSFELIKSNVSLGIFNTKLLGVHNIENCIGSLTMMIEQFGAQPKKLQEVLPDFLGITRRLDRKTKIGKIPVYEGFGSSYTKAKTAIDAMLLHFPESKLEVIFEPHTFGWRNRENLNWYHDVFHGCSKVHVYKPPTHGKETHEQLTLNEITHEISSHNENIIVEPFTDSKEFLEAFLQESHAGKTILLLTSGSLDGLVQSIPEALNNKKEA